MVLRILPLPSAFEYEAFTLSGWLSQNHSSSFQLTYAVHDPAVHAPRFRLLPFRSPLLRKSMFLSFPPPTKMFQFRGLAHLTMCQVFYLTGCPIQKSSDQVLFANPRSLSQLTTSFFASKSLGIPHTPLFTFLQLLTQPIPA